jgi:hypothetical protein
LEQLPPALRKAVEQMLWRAKGCVESRKWITPRLMSPAKSEWIKVGPDPGHPFLFVLPPAPIGKQVEIQKTKGAFAHFWGMSRNHLHAILR